MNNQFSQRVSDIIVYSKEEANRLRSRHIGPEHLLLGMLRDGEGKAIEILSKLNTNLAAVKQQIEARLKTEADDMLLPYAEIPLSNDAAIASFGVLAARIIRITSSILSEAMIKPSRICARSFALRRSN